MTSKPDRAAALEWANKMKDWLPYSIESNVARAHLEVCAELAELRRLTKAVVEGYDKMDLLIPPCQSTPMQSLRTFLEKNNDL